MNEILPWIQSLLPVGALGYLMKRWVDGIDKTMEELRVEVGEVKESIANMAVKNAEDHGEVRARIASIETKLETFPAPWQAKHTPR